MDIVTIGSLVFDTINTSKGNRNVVGGSAIYSALAASTISDTGLVATVGKDFPKNLLPASEKLTLSISRRNVPNSQFNLIHECANAAEFAADDFEIPDKFRKPASLHLGSHDPQLQEKMLERFKPRKWVSMDTHDCWAKSKRSYISKLAGSTDVLFVNEKEAQLLSGEKDLMKAAGELGKWKIAVIKRGAQGVIIAADDVWELPAFDTKVVDTTGAGDAFAGAFMAYLSRRPSIIKAAAYGTVLASFAIEDWGITRLMHLQRKDVNKRYKAYLKSLDNF